MSALAIVNPAAGGGRCGRRYEAALDGLRAQGHAIDVALTASPGDATRLAREAYAAGTRAFLAVGGDGTSYEIVNGLYPEAAEGEAPLLGFLPLGTGNSFLRDFTDEGADYALEAWAAGKERRCDVVRARHTQGAIHYINLLSVGFVADVNAFTCRHLKPLGEAGYSLGVVRQLAGLKPRAFPMTTAEGEAHGEPLVFASVNNSRFTGGKMMMAPHADTADGRVDLVLCGAMGRFELLRTFPKIFTGAHVETPKVTSTHVEGLRFDLDGPVDIMVDGEVERLQLTAIDILPSALRIAV